MRLSELAIRLGGELEGEDAELNGLSAPEHPIAGTVVVVDRKERLPKLGGAGLSGLVVPVGLEAKLPASAVRVADAKLALAQLTTLFDTRPLPQAGVHPTAVVAPTARLESGVSVGAHAVIEAASVIGAGAVIGAGCYVGEGARVGAHSRLYPNVTLYDGVTLGERVIVHSGAVIGSDGFGYAASPKGAVKIHHLGSVEIGDDAEIGAGSCVDRGTLGPTRIGARTKIDNLCQIGHNVQVGSDCLIAGQSGISGSVVVEDGVIMGGAVSVVDHVRIGRGARLAGRSGVSKNIPAGETWAGLPAQPHRKWVRELYLLSRLERIWEAVRTLTRAGEKP